MSKQVQLRRGTTLENDAFVGAVGELTYDTESKGLRAHDGQTLGGVMIDSVVWFQIPTADNNWTWARVYASGWCEQGGTVPGGTAGNYTVELPVEMAVYNYAGFTSCNSNGGDNVNFMHISIWDRTTTSFVCRRQQGNRFWQIQGMANMEKLNEQTGTN